MAVTIDINTGQRVNTNRSDSLGAIKPEIPGQGESARASGTRNAGGLDADARLALQLQIEETRSAAASRRERPQLGAPVPLVLGASDMEERAAYVDPQDRGASGTRRADHGEGRAVSSSAPGGRRLQCSMGCGRPASHGKDGRGVPYTTCCRGCAVTGVHDALCREGTSDGAALEEGQSDFEIAMSLQLAEVQNARQYARVRRRVAEMVRYAWDPVWGEIEFASIDANDTQRRRRQTAASCLFATCPCMMITCGCFRSELSRPLSKAEVRRAWGHLLCSWSVLFGVFQVAMMVYLLLTFHMEELRENPMLGPSYYALDVNGAKNAARMKYRHEWWRLLSPMLLHAGWIHLLSNLILQFRVSIVLEALWGSIPYFIIYIVSGAYGSLASCVFMPNSLSVGSSGALCGLIGAWGPFILTTWNQTLPRDVKQRNAQITLILSAVVLLVPLSFLPLVDFAAHMGGLIMGAALSLFVFASRVQTTGYRIGSRVFGGVLVLALWGSFGYWFWFHVEPDKALLSLCPPPGCMVVIFPNGTVVPAEHLEAP